MVSGTNDKLLTVAQVCVLLGCVQKTVLRHIAAGRLPALKTPGGHYRVRESDLVRLEAIPVIPDAEREADG